jgi:hypothetical protein
MDLLKAEQSANWWSAVQMVGRYAPRNAPGSRSSPTPIGAPEHTECTSLPAYSRCLVSNHITESGFERWLRY